MDGPPGFGLLRSSGGGGAGGEDVAAVTSLVGCTLDLGGVVAVRLEAREDVGRREAGAVQSEGVDFDEDRGGVGRAEKTSGAVEHEGLGSLGIDLEQVDVLDAAGGEVVVERDGGNVHALAVVAEEAVGFGIVSGEVEGECAGLVHDGGVDELCVVEAVEGDVFLEAGEDGGCGLVGDDTRAEGGGEEREVADVGADVDEEGAGMKERLDVLGGDILFADALKEVPLGVDDAGDAGPGAAGKMADEPGAGGSAQAGLAAGRRIGGNETADGAIPERRSDTLRVGRDDHKGPTVLRLPRILAFGCRRSGKDRRASKRERFQDGEGEDEKDTGCGPEWIVGRMSEPPGVERMRCGRRVKGNFAATWRSERCAPRSRDRLRKTVARYHARYPTLSRFPTPANKFAGAPVSRAEGGAPGLW